MVLLFAFVGCDDAPSCFGSASAPSNVTASISNSNNIALVRFNAAYDASSYNFYARVVGSRTLISLTPFDQGVVINAFTDTNTIGAALTSVDPNALYVRIYTVQIQNQLAVAAASTQQIEFGVRTIGIGGMDQGPSSIVWSTAQTLNIAAQ